MMKFPADPIAAVTHPDPYPYYADLLARKPIYRAEALGLWIASSTAAVGAVLGSNRCRVRPPAEPIPKALLGSPAADIFRHLVRMNDGPGHCAVKQAVTTTLLSLVPTETARQSRQWARFLFDDRVAASDGEALARFMFRLPIYVIATLLGISQEQLPQTALWIGDFVRCLAPASDAQQIEQGKMAAGHLLDLFRSLLRARPGGHSMLASLARVLSTDGQEDVDAIVANAIGFLSQAYEATAGLIGNTLVALATQHQMREQIAGDASLIRDAVEEVLRYDPAVQNTRRFVAESGLVAGEQMQTGDTILVVLAAANRDAALNPNPERFDIRRCDRRIVSFGSGVHACPGSALAINIAAAGVAELIESGSDFTQLGKSVRYRHSFNTRIPIFVDN
jgi:cytochrome P450